jgi:alkanesulfonate monooxygenase SsuD/methylene tetrahydromethanopterin reductase-like flavin-dependent oxidoreductase (luciferase family)
MTAATLDDLSGGRFTIGLGTSTAMLAERFHGVAFARPAGRLRQVATGVRTLLDGDRIATASGDPGLRLGYRPRARVPIWIAGLGPKAVAVATEVGDGWIPALVPRDRLDQARCRAIEAAAGDPELISGPMAGPATATVTSRHAAQQLVGWYLTGMGPFYGDLVAASGFGAEIEAIRAANPKPRPGAVVWPSDADPLLAQLAVHGGPSEVASQIASWDRLADVVSICVGPGPVESVLALVAAAAPSR